MIRSTQSRTPSSTCSQLSMTSSASRSASDATSATVDRRGPLLGNADRLGDRRGDHRRVRHVDQIDEPRPVAARRGELGGDAERQPGLADAARTGRGDHAVLGERRGQRRPLAAAADERRDRQSAALRRPDLTRRPGIASASCRARLRRSGSCSLRSIADTWLSTVRTEMNSASAICAFVRCRPIRARTSASRAVTSAPFGHGPRSRHAAPCRRPQPSVLGTGARDPCWARMCHRRSQHGEPRHGSRPPPSNRPQLRSTP